MSNYFPYGELEIEVLCASEPLLGKAIKQIGRLEREVQKTPFEALVSAIVGQLVSVHAAKAIWLRIVEKCGDITPERMLKIGLADLKSCGLTQRKSEYIYGFSEMLLKHPSFMKSLEDLEDEEVIRQLSQFKGIGVWTAEMVLIHGLKRANVLSWGDLAIRKGLEKLYQIEKIDYETFLAFKNKVSPYGTVASIYLWQIAFRKDFDVTAIDESTMWQAVNANDASYDGQFYYGVKSTRIFCRPSCASKAPKQTNVIYFKTLKEAQETDYRPCKRCRPDLSTYEPQREIAAQIKTYIQEHYKEEMKLSELFKSVGVSQSRGSLIFKAIYESTPKGYLNTLRVSQAKRLLEKGTKIINVALECGYGSLSSFYFHFKQAEGMTPSAYQNTKIK